MTLSNTVAALLTLAVFTLIWKEGPIFTFVEHLLVGLAAAHSMAISFDNYLKPTIKTEIIGQGKWYLAFFLLFGALMYLRHIPKLSWVARYPISWFVGYGAGYTIALAPKPLMTQIIDTFIPLNSVNNVIYFFTTVLTISYFFLTAKWRESTSAGRAIDVWARRVMMLGFGSSFGSIVQGYVSRILGRLEFLLVDWLGFH